MLKESIVYPFNGESRVKPVVITTVLFTLSVLLLPFVIVVGYVMTVIKQTAAGNNSPPEYTDWKLFTNRGLQGVAVTILYLLIPITLFGISAWLVNPELSETVEPTIVDLIALGFAMLSLTSYLVIHYILPVAIAITAITGSVKQAFNYKRISEVVRSLQYLKGFVIGFVLVQVTGGLFLVALIVVTSGFGALLTPVVYAYLYIQIGYLIGESYRTALEV